MVFDENICEDMNFVQLSKGFVVMVGEKFGVKLLQFKKVFFEGDYIIICIFQIFLEVMKFIEDMKELCGRCWVVVVDEVYLFQLGFVVCWFKEFFVDVGFEFDEDDIGMELSVDDLLWVKDFVIVLLSNIIFIVFMVILKVKMLCLFGIECDGCWEVFDIYMMVQVIEEGFIFDVFQNYLIYDMFFCVKNMFDFQYLEIEYCVNISEVVFNIVWYV